MSQRFEQPLVSIDVVPLSLDQDDTLTVTLAKRLNEPYRDALALPGVLMGRERSIDAAHRALTTKAGIEPGDVTLRDVGVFDAPQRDPRGPTMAIAKAAIGSRAAMAGTGSAASVSDLPDLPFDHESIVGAAIQWLAHSVWTDREVARAILGEAFTTRTATALQRQLEQATTGEVRAAASNMKRRLIALRWCRETGETAAPRGRGRPSSVWEWA